MTYSKKFGGRVTVKELTADLDSGRVSSFDLAQQCLTEIENNKDLNAFIDVQPELTLSQAREADRRRARGEKGPLLGVPIAHKDVFVTRHWRSTAGSRMLSDYMSPFDATVVSLLQQAGAVCVGKTNCDEFAMGSTNEHSYFGPVKNPWDKLAIPGGSSGGSAAAVSARLVPLATGTDTGGSVRQPAAMCGVTGIKPTYGRVSRYGMIAFASSLDQAGILGLNVADCAQVLSVIAGSDPKDSTSLNKAPEDFSRLLNATVTGMRVGIPSEFFDQEGISKDVRNVLEAALSVYESMGVTLVPVSLSCLRFAVPAYYILASAEASSNLSRFDGVRYGYRAKDPVDLEDLYRRTRTEGFGPEVKRRILVGTYVLSKGYYEACYRRAQRLRRIIADDFRRVLEQVDFIASPVSPTVAWDLGKSSAKDNPVHDYLADIYTLPASLAGLPAISIPAGFGDSGRPVGLQLIARACDEARLCGIAHQFQCATDWHLKVPSP